MQNMNLKHLNIPENHQRYLRRMVEARILLNFGAEICKLVASYGGTFLFEHPWTSKAWNEPRIVKLIEETENYLIKNDQCMFKLQDTEGNFYQKPTGWLTNNKEVAAALDRRCDRLHQHQPVLGRGHHGNRSREAQQYPKRLIHAVLNAYQKSLDQPVHHVEITTSESMLETCIYHEELYEAMLQDVTVENIANKYDKSLDEKAILKSKEITKPNEAKKNDKVEKYDDTAKKENVTEETYTNEENDVTEEIYANEEVGEEGLEEIEDEEEKEEEELVRPLPREQPMSLQHLVRRAHCGLGHPGNEKLVRILKQAKASEEAIKIARGLQCPTCQRHQKTRPPRAGAPPRELVANQILGVDSVWLPGIDPRGQCKLAVNMIDWATRFQLVVPVKNHSPTKVKNAVYQWIRIFGHPERIYTDLGREFKGDFATFAEEQAMILDVGSLETPTQRSITERAGKTFKEVLSKTLVHHNCDTWEQWREAVDVVNMTVNRLSNKSGYSPIQRMLGYTPRLPGGLLGGGFNDESTASKFKMGDQQIQRSVQLRKAAAIAYHEADCDQSLRNALYAGSRKVVDYEVGQVVYFWRKGAERQKKDNYSYWNGPAKVILTNPPNSIWLTFQGKIVKASPEHLRPATEEEHFTLTDWIDAIADTKKQLQEKEGRDYIVLKEKPDAEDEATDVEEEQPEIKRPRPRYYIQGKTHPSKIEFKDENLPTIEDETKMNQPEPEEIQGRMGEQRRRSEDIIIPDLNSDIPSPSTAPAESEGEDILKENDGMIDGGSRSEAVEMDEENRSSTRPLEDQGADEAPTKRRRLELLEMLYLRIDNLSLMRKRKELSYSKIKKEDKEKFRRAIDKEIKNNLETGAYEILDKETSEMIRRSKPDKILKSRYVFTEKLLEPEEVEKFQKEGLMISGDDGNIYKAKARHVMKGFSENGAENLESTTPQVANPADVMQQRLGDWSPGLHSSLSFGRLDFERTLCRATTRRN